MMGLGGVNLILNSVFFSVFFGGIISLFYAFDRGVVLLSPSVLKSDENLF